MDTPAQRSPATTDARSPAAQSIPDIEILPATPWRLGLRELWSYRELAFFLAWRNVKVRHKQTILGAGWIVVQPLLLMVLFQFVFRRIGRVPVPEGVPYSLFALSALVPWVFFSQSFNAASDSLVSSAHLITKIYFPRLVAPVAAAAGYLLDLMVGLAVLLVVMGLNGVWPTWRFLAVPALVLLVFTCSLSLGVWTSALSVRYRDVRQAIRYILQGLLFASPIAYSAAAVGGTLRWVYLLNPLSGIAEGFRWAVLGLDNDPGQLIASSIGVTLLALVTGLFYFKKVERTFADVI